nr:serine protease [Paracoccus saliphilus]
MITIQDGPDAFVEVAGAGIILHQTGMSSIIATAAHTLEYVEGSGIYVEFFEDLGRKYPADVIYADSGLDLAFLRVPTPEEVVAEFKEKNDILMPTAFRDVLVGGVYAIGNPGQRPWFGNRRPDPLLSDMTDPSMIAFQSSIVIDGMSGGGLFSEHGTLLGMVLDVGSSGGAALATEEILVTALRENIPVSLRDRPQAVTSIAALLLADLGKDVRTTLASDMAASPIDYGMLHLYWMSAPPADAFETVLSAPWIGGNASVLQHFLERTATAATGAEQGRATCTVTAEGEVEARLLEAAVARFEGSRDQSCDDQLKVFLCGAIETGVSPDLILPARGTFRRYSNQGGRDVDERIEWDEAVLATALRAGNDAAARALLECGAAAHPYQQLHGQLNGLDDRFAEPAFIDPIARATSEEVADLLRESGALRLGRERPVSFKNMVDTEETFSAQLNRICARVPASAVNEWCQDFAERGREIEFTGWTGPEADFREPVSRMFLIHPLTLGENYAFFYVNFAPAYEVFQANSSVDIGQIGVALVPIDPNNRWFLYGRVENFGDRCYGGEYCWRAYEISPVD